ncbi:Trehalose synthase [uncultured archaeon]|nr:Trehalose synthase [uncultured archaeon]
MPNGIDGKIISGIKPSIHKCDVIFVGRLIKEKNADVLIKAIGNARKTLPEIKCHIIGDGPEREKLTSLVSECGLTNNVRFFGFMDHMEVIALIKSSKALVLPSEREGFGMVVIEAYACGVPVVTVRSPRNAASELVNEKTGFVVNLDDRELGETICILMKDAELRKKMSSAALETSKAYDWDKISGQLISVYGKLHPELAGIQVNGV